MEIKYERPNQEMIRYIADNMRQADVDEIWASNHFTPGEALKIGLKDSDYTTIAVVNNEPCVMFGLLTSTLLTGGGVIWMLGSNASTKYKRKFLIETPKVIDEMFKVCTYLYNYVHCKNTTTIRWLKWMGFTFEPAAPYGVEKEMFHRFYKVRN